jgi:hypothetical protein
VDHTPTLPSGDWTVGRYPAGHRFAFTIVHDADSAYSRRLAPLFEVFDALGLRLTVSAFALWADWARDGAIWSRWRGSADAAERLRAPMSVPLCDVEECAFYQSLAARGHEIALHTPRETSSRREDLPRAFELFERAFGRSPAVYTEHSRRTKRDALANEGADPGSPYYCLDLLARYGPWVCVDGPGAMYGDDAPGAPTFAIPPDASPIDRRARQRYGLARAFVRTGGWKNSDGDGFLRSYSTANLDALEGGGGLALVYSHLDAGWLDPATRQMRPDLRRRLEYLAAKPGWFAPAGEILDRVQAADAVAIRSDGRDLTITNPGLTRLERLPLRNRSSGEERVIASLAAGETIRIAD